MQSRLTLVAEGRAGDRPAGGDAVEATDEAAGPAGHVDRCLECGGDVGLSHGRPVVVGGRIRLRCPRCAEKAARAGAAAPAGDARLAKRAHTGARSREGTRRREVTRTRGTTRARAFRLGVLGSRGAVVSCGVAAVALATLVAAVYPRSKAVSREAPVAAATMVRAGVAPGVAASHAAAGEPPRAAARGEHEASAAQVEPEEAPPEAPLAPAHAATAVLPDGPPLAPGDWVYPLPDVHQSFPLRNGRRFGAERSGGAHRPECGGGHCGVDLYAPRGTPVVAVAAGVVQRVVRDRDGRAGLYVEITHAAGLATLYMHLKEIRDDLACGLHVKRGEWIGTLGRTGTHRTPPHLHFAVKSLKSWPPQHVDPEPLLVGASVMSLFDMTVGLPEVR